jgi:sugar-specific transcriptional regulator TrmB
VFSICTIVYLDRGFFVREDLVKALTDFGLSCNQAKVYLSIVQSPRASVNTISKDTKIHKQDVYMILPKLEKMGLITKSVGRPLYIKALPPETALNYIINAEQQAVNQKIRRLKQTVKWLSESIESLAGTHSDSDGLEVQAVFCSADNAVNSKLDEAYASAKSKCCLVINFNLLRRRVDLLERRFHLLATNNVKTRILIDNMQKVEDAYKILKQILPQIGDFIIKKSGKVTIKPYVLIDDKVVLIATQEITAGGFPCLLWTNAPNVIAIYRDNFEKAWECSHSILLNVKTSNTRRTGIASCLAEVITSNK